MKTNHISSFRHASLSLAWLVCSMAVFSFSSCRDEDLSEGGRSKSSDVTVRFNTSDVQALSISLTGQAPKATPGTRGGSVTDQLPQRHSAFTTDGSDFSLVETTIDGVNPVKPEKSTRGTLKTSIDAKFSTFGYRGTSEQGISQTPDWFYNASTLSNGDLVTPVPWSWAEPYARFYGIYPEVTPGTKISVSPQSHSGRPYIDFESETDVSKQSDLLTACSGVIHYSQRWVSPLTPLKFRHALCAVRFAVGSNLSWDKTIDRVEVRNVRYKGRYTLSDQSDGSGASWDLSATEGERATMILDGVNVSTSSSPNTIIMGEKGDNFTFFMIPQMITKEDNVVIYFHCTDGTEITAPIKNARWLAGTTKTYKISQKRSDWTYHIEATNPSVIAFNQNVSPDAYGITSYRITNTGAKQAVKWKVAGYDANDDGKFGMDEKPAWLTGLSKTGGDGGEVAETGLANVTIDIKDYLKQRNESLKNAPTKGSPSKYYNLSNQTDGGDAIENTANSYLISSPGYYRLPLVYGNAIKNGQINTSAYIAPNPGSSVILAHFVDHNNQPINSPYIMVQNADDTNLQPSIVWADVKNAVSHLSVVGSGKDAYLQFKVSKENIRNGNAVVMVADAQGVARWSWHLWFAPEEAMNLITWYNRDSKTFQFPKEPLGFYYVKWFYSTYDTPRTVKVKVEQETGQYGKKEYAVITVTQNPGGDKEYEGTYYQHGRKDAFPHKLEKAVEGSIQKDEDNTFSIAAGIQKPSVIYHYKMRPYRYINTWCTNYNQIKAVLTTWTKTIYDPSPVGFQVPCKEAFTGFYSKEEKSKDTYDLYMVGDWYKGGYLITKPTASGSIFFPALDEFEGPPTGTGVIYERSIMYWALGISRNITSGAYAEGFNAFSDKTVQMESGVDRGAGYPVWPMSEQ